MMNSLFKVFSSNTNRVDDLSILASIGNLDEIKRKTLPPMKLIH